MGEISRGTYKDDESNWVGHPWPSGRLADWPECDGKVCRMEGEGGDVGIARFYDGTDGQNRSSRGRSGRDALEPSNGIHRGDSLDGLSRWGDGDPSPGRRSVFHAHLCGYRNLGRSGMWQAGNLFVGGREDQRQVLRDSIDWEKGSRKSGKRKPRLFGRAKIHSLHGSNPPD